MNVASGVSPQQVKRVVVGFGERPASAEEQERMNGYVAQAMEQGALGLTAAWHAKGPECPDEVVSMARVVRKYGGYYGVHLGSEGFDIMEELEKALKVGTGDGHPHPRLPSEDALQGELGAGHAGGGADRGGPARGPGRHRQPVSLYRHAAPVAEAVPALGAGRAGAGDHRRVHEPELSPAGHGRSRVHPVRQRTRRLGGHRGGASGQARAPRVGGQDHRADRGEYAARTPPAPAST